MLHHVRNVVERRMPVDLRLRGLEQSFRLSWVRRDDVVRPNDPETHALEATRIDVPGVAQGQLRIGRVNRAHMLMGKTPAGAHEASPERPIVTHPNLPHLTP